MQFFSSFLAFFLSFLSLALAQEQGSGLPFITADPPSSTVNGGGVVLTGTVAPTASLTGPISEGGAGVVSRLPTGAQSSVVVVSTVDTGATPSGTLLLDTTGSSPSPSTPAGSTVTRTTTVSPTAEGNLAPATSPWQSWVAVVIGGLAVAAGLM